MNVGGQVEGEKNKDDSGFLLSEMGKQWCPFLRQRTLENQIAHVDSLGVKVKRTDDLRVEHIECEMC